MSSSPKTLSSCLGPRFAHRGQLFVCDERFYHTIHTDDGATHALRKLHTWLGVKPAYRYVRYADEPHPDTLCLPSDLVAHPYTAAALLALLAVNHAAQALHRMSNAYEDSIDIGFGLVVLNGLVNPSPLRVRLYNGLHAQSQYQTISNELAVSPKEYGEALAAYIALHHHLPEAWAPYLHGQARTKVSVRPHVAQHIPAARKPHAAARHHAHAKRHFIRLFILCATISIIVVMALYVYYNSR